MSNKHIIIFMVIACLINTQAHAKQTIAPSSNKNNAGIPALIKADKLFYNKDNQTIVATGNVEINQNDRILIADKIIYNLEKDIIYAKENISLLENNGDVYFADEIKLSNNMKEAIITTLKARLSDNTLLSAKYGMKKNQNTYVLNNAVYSPCNVCNTINGKSIPPLWQVKAKNITLDEESEEIRYKHAWLEVLGTPTIYTPYLSHATPNAKRKSGFLTPTYGNSSSLGTLIKVPYYWNIAPNSDAVITPIYTGNEEPVLTGEYRHLTANGRLEINGSITNPNERNNLGQTVPGKKQLRSHIEGYGHFSLENDWSWGFRGKRSSDDTYLRRYNFGDETYLTTRLYAQKLTMSDYITVETLSFQGVQANDDPGKTPLILPLINTYNEFHTKNNMGTLTLHSNLLTLSRDEGTETRRLSITGGWEKDLITKSGHVFRLNNTVRTDGYSIHDNSLTDDDQTKTRVIPQMELQWSLPLTQHNQNYSIDIEPISNIIISPYGNNPDIIPNEDSQFAEIADYNIFSSNRFTGLDKVETGLRTNYGLKGRLYSNRGFQINMLAGQSYRPKRTSSTSTITGFNRHFSDYVGRIGLSIFDKLDFTYRFRTNNRDFETKRNEIESSINWDPLALNVQYISLNEASNNNLGKREEILASSKLQLSQDWLISAQTRYDLSSNGGAIYNGANILYSNNCLDVSLDWFREFTRDRDIEPSTSITVQVSLKGLN